MYGADVTESDENRLVEQVALGNESAFEQIYRSHVDHVLKTAAWRCDDPHEVADIVAETFLAVWLGAGTYQPDRGTLRHWIAGIAARKFLDLKRTYRRKVALQDRLAGRAQITPDEYEALGDQLDALRLADTASAAIAGLPIRQRVVFELVAIDGLSVNAAAEALAMTPAAVSMRLTRARRALQGTLPPQPQPTLTGSES
ncbi:MAG TPA: RNA polymerase subunit sigma [Acidimicrobiaceae bacterium]|jgi:RNA polymerase sigma factor (sigma-70 family)|nr:RNA polymerase subunit sigma [Acidimicrobiaceae bacterium]